MLNDLWNKYLHYMTSIKKVYFLGISSSHDNISKTTKPLIYS